MLPTVAVVAGGAVAVVCPMAGPYHHLGSGARSVSCRFTSWYVAVVTVGGEVPLCSCAATYPLPCSLVLSFRVFYVA